jgi:hypothetical protein
MSHLLRLLSAGLLSGLLVLFHTPLSAGELLDSYVNEQDDHYVLHLDMRINASYDKVYAVLIDFSKMHAVNDSITESKLIESKGKVHKVHFVAEGCIWFFCKKVRQLVTVTELGKGFILSKTDPRQSDLSYGKTLWQLIDEGKTTRVKYNADYVPDFWIPPFFGPMIFKNRMLKEGKKTVNGIERLSAEEKGEARP